MKLVDVDIKLGSVVTLKKGHPCGSNQWAVVRFGVDCKIRCMGCGRIVLIDRVDLKKAIKKVLDIPYEGPFEENH
jgi:hypothetical protein